MTKAQLFPDITGELAWSSEITAYDETHFITYVRLFDVDAEGAIMAEMAQIVIGIDPNKESRRAEMAVASYLRRARWMTEVGYHQLIDH